MILLSFNTTAGRDILHVSPPPNSSTALFNRITFSALSKWVWRVHTWGSSPPPYFVVPKWGLCCVWEYFQPSLLKRGLARQSFSLPWWITAYISHWARAGKSLTDNCVLYGAIKGRHLFFNGMLIFWGLYISLYFLHNGTFHSSADFQTLSSPSCSIFIILNITLS